MLFASSAINGAGLIVYGNGVKLTGVSANANTDELHHIQFKTDVFPKEASNGYAVPTVVIKAGSVLAQNNSVVAARITKDVTLAYVGGKTGLDFEENKSVIASEVRIFTEEKNYPVYFHCALGRDRTGTLAMLLEGLCGVSEGDILLDYELSSLSVAGTKDKNKISYMINNLFKPTMDYIKSFGDGSLQSGCENFLLSCGLTKTEINKITEIMVL